jgi:class 3 adenylate cyclase/tetratricopeptide (TPR) repeat protein
VRCPACGEENPERAKFCLNCGTPLTTAPAPVRQERKIVSVLFCDLVGFTAASEGADPEDVQARLSTYHSMLRQEIERYGGTVEKFIGDAVMAVFGAPVAHEDDAERAVRAGLRIVEATTELSEHQAEQDLQVRVGINTGEVLVNLSARPERGEGFVTGDVVNTASRIQGVAPVGGVAVGEQTYSATAMVFDYRELPQATLKGKAEKVRLFHARASLSRFGTDLTRQHTTPLVGREIDLALLKGAFDKAVAGPSLQLVTVVGEPGVGKSRLVAALFDYLDSLPQLVRFRQGHCLPYGDGITFWAVGEIVKAEVGVLDSDDPATASRKLELAIARLVEDPDDQRWVIDRLAPLLGLATFTVDRDETYVAWRRFLEAAAAENPLVCVIEDLHWADAALLGFIEHLAEWCHGVPLLVIGTARPELYEQHPSWGAGLRNRFDLSLGPLSTAESAKLVAALLGRAVLPASTQSLLVERSGGNPLYAEEFVRMLSDRKLLDGKGGLAVDAEELSFPSSVQAIIAARLDTLPAVRKGVLQDAAVVGKVFWAGAVASLGERPEKDIANDLHELAKKELVRPSRTSTVAGQLEASFWHGLIREVAYGEIPRAARASKHAAAARWIERTAGDRVEEQAEVLAHHYLTAVRLAEATAVPGVDELKLRARRHLLTAARRAGYVDVPRSESLARAALEVTPPDHEDRPDAESALAAALVDAGETEEARHLLDSAIAQADRRGNLRQRARAELLLSGVTQYRDPAEADRMVAEVIASLEALPPGPELITALRNAAGRAMLAARYADVPALTDRVLKLLDEGVDVEGSRSVLRAEALHFRGYSRFSAGDLRGLEDLRASIALDPNNAMFRNNLALALSATEGFAPAVAEVQEAIRISTAQGAALRVAMWKDTLLTFYYPLGRWDELVELARPLLSHVAEVGDEYAEASVETSLAQVLLRRGAPSAAEHIASALPRARTIGDTQVLLPALVVAASSAHASGDRGELGRLLSEIEPALAQIGDDLSPMQLPEVVRIAVGIGDLRLAERVSGSRPTYPAGLAAAASARATIREAEEQLDEAIASYRDAAPRWAALGHVVERAYALLGLGRSRITAGDTEGAEDLVTARGIFAGLRAQPLLAEVDRCLADQQRLSS